MNQDKRAMAEPKVLAKVLFAAVVALALSGCHRPAISGFGFSGKVRPDPGVTTTIKPSDITDPTAALNVIKVIEENSPAPGGHHDYTRERAIWDARLTKAPAASTYLLTIQCGTRDMPPRYFWYDLNGGTAIVRLYDDGLYGQVKQQVEGRGLAVRHAVYQLSWPIAVLEGADPENPMGEDHEWDQIERPLREKGANIQLPDGVTFKSDNSILSFLSESYLRRAQYNLNLSNWQLHNTGKLRNKLPSPKLLLDDEKAWDAGPLPGLATADLPLKGGSDNACLIARVADLDTEAANIDGRYQTLLHGSIVQWYLVDKSSGRVLAQTTSAAVANITPEQRP